MKVLIIEDEKPAFENIVQELNSIDENVQVVATCSTIRESVHWLEKNLQPDLILMDIQLTDGLSFCIFNSVNITCPVIFITAYDKYLTEAFDYNSIDYLLKPINHERLKNAIRKYKNLQQHFVNNHSVLNNIMNGVERKRSRVLVKRGMEFQTIRVEDIVYFFTEHKLIFLVDKDNRKYLAEKNNLAELEDELDNRFFYRANRKYIINVNYVKRFKPLEKSKISLELSLPVSEEIIISQENASSFKKWISEA
ncbi:MAG: response regulator transcription factor [Bacteroidetes bacterium]|nr:response regulator transcription factor [Bacteroidota bacterium]MBS1934490.1 response regulator transcription factor [Bacteroidota bacterium]